MTRAACLAALCVGLAAAGAAPAAAAAAPGPLPLADVDMSRVWGGWYIVATIPNSFERGMVAPYDVYTPGKGTRIEEDFSVRRGAFSAPIKHFHVHDWVRPGTHNAHWRVQVFWPVNLPFLVLWVDPHDRFILFGEEGRDLGWIYAREARISEADYAMLMGRFAAAGYDPSRFRRIIQAPDQIGQPGFWSDGVRAEPPAEPAQ
jgi:apolipoprotein D and lipocalin family protein